MKLGAASKQGVRMPQLCRLV